LAGLAPRVHRLAGVDGARAARGHAVIIDVLRAATTAAHALAAGAPFVALVATAEEAFALRRERWPDALLAGEIGGRPIDGFDLGNSPSAIARLDLAARPVLLRTSSGTQGVVAARDAERVLFCGLVVARATVDYLIGRGADPVGIVAMGSPGGPDGPEDEACAEHLERLLTGRPTDPADVVARVRASPAAAQALDPAIDWIVPDDLDAATDLDRFPFAMVVAREPDGRTCLARAITG